VVAPIVIRGGHRVTDAPLGGLGDGIVIGEGCLGHGLELNAVVVRTRNAVVVVVNDVRRVVVQAVSGGTGFGAAFVR